MPQYESRFDAQAANYDARAGLPDEVCAEIAGAIVRLCGSARGQTLLELGAGTGQLGASFLALGLRYLGLDLSPGMLAKFRERMAVSGAAAELVLADVNQAWPVADGSMSIIFSSRALHLFDLEHVAREARRVARRAKAALVVGRVERDPNGMRSVLRREMRALVRERGFEPNEGARRGRDFLDALRGQGASRLGPEPCARWDVVLSAADVLDAWRRKSELGGVALAPALQAEVLAELERFALLRFGSLDARTPAEERYVIEGALLG